MTKDPLNLKVVEFYKAFLQYEHRFYEKFSEKSLAAFRVISKQLRSYSEKKLYALSQEGVKYSTRKDNGGVNHENFGELNGYLESDGTYYDCWPCGHDGYENLYCRTKHDGLIKIHAMSRSVCHLYVDKLHLYTQVQVKILLLMAIRHNVFITLRCQ